MVLEELSHKGHVGVVADELVAIQGVVSDQERRQTDADPQGCCHQPRPSDVARQPPQAADRQDGRTGDNGIAALPGDQPQQPDRVFDPRGGKLSIGKDRADRPSQRISGQTDHHAGPQPIGRGGTVRAAAEHQGRNDGHPDQQEERWARRFGGKGALVNQPARETEHQNGPAATQKGSLLP